MANTPLFFDMPLAQLWDLKAELEFIRFVDVIEQIGKQQTNRTAKAICEEMGIDLFCFLDERLADSPIQQVAKAITAFLKHNRKHKDLMLFDLKGYDVNFSFLEPPTLHISQLEQALKAVFEHPDKLADFRYIGFRREELEQVLNLELLSEENQQMLAELERRTDIKFTADDENTKLKNENQELREMLAMMACDLSVFVDKGKTKKKLTWGNKVNKAQLAIHLHHSKFNGLFSTAKGEEKYRKALNNLDLPTIQ